MEDEEIRVNEDEEEEVQATGGFFKENLVVIVLGFIAVAGLALGSVGMIMAMGLTSNVEELQQIQRTLRAEVRDIGNRPDRSADVEASLRSELNKVDERLVNVGSEVTRSNRALRDQVQSGLDSLSREIRNNRERIHRGGEDLSALSERIAELEEKTNNLTVRTPARRQSESRASSTSSESGDQSREERSTEAVEAPQDGIHVIQAGDTFGVLARRYGVSLDALLDANPGVDPRRLQIGQHIIIP